MTQGRKTSPLRLAEAVMGGIEKHAYSNLSAEVGGMLMGTVKGNTTHIDGFIPALSASAEQVTLTFTHEVWEDILKVAAKDFPDKEIVGWYHTHPTFGIFLSDYDLFIQENFFAKKGNVALVIDPVQGLYGWFSKDAKGTVKTFEEGPTQTGPKRSIDPLELPDSPRKKSAAKMAGIGLVGMVLGAAIGSGIVGSQSPPDLSNALATSRAETQEARDAALAIQQRLGMIVEQPVLTYQIQEGDNLASVVRIFYEDFPAGYFAILTANDFAPGERLAPGARIVIPSPSWIGVSPLSSSEIRTDTPEGSRSLAPPPQDSAPEPDSLPDSEQSEEPRDD